MSTPKNRSPERITPPSGGTTRDRATAHRSEARIYAVAGILLVCCIVMMANYLAFRHYRRWDWTTEQRFTLSPRSIQVMHELGADLDVYLLLSDGEPNYQDIRELLDRYRAESNHLQLHFVDPVRSPAEYRTLADRYGLGEAAFGDGMVGADSAVLMVSGDRHWTITRDDLVAIQFDAADPSASRIDTRAEQAISGGIVEVTLGRRTKVCLTEGHGEWSRSGGSERNLSVLETELRRENVELEGFRTQGAARVPEGCDALFVVGAVQAFTTEEATLLRDYVRGGGNLFVAADAELDRGEVRRTGLEEVLRDFGVRLDRAVVLEMDASHLQPGQPDPAGPFYVTDYGEHEVTRSLSGSTRPSVFWVARPVRPVDGTSATTLFSTSASSFAEFDVAALINSREPQRDDADLPGPVSLAVATRVERDGAADAAEATESSRGGRVVVVGDAEFLRGDALQALEVANFDLASAIVGWLTAREALIAIPARDQQAQPIRMSADDAWNLGARVVVLMPLAMVFLGFAVWWSRRA